MKAILQSPPPPPPPPPGPVAGAGAGGTGTAGAHDGRAIFGFGEITQIEMIAGVEFAAPSLLVTVNDILPT